MQSKYQRSTPGDTQQGGFAVIGLIVAMAAFAVIGVAVWQYSQHADTQPSAASNTPTQTALATALPTPTPTPRPADSADTLANPQKVASADGKTYFIYGAPAGQNNAAPKRIIISLPGHGTTADDGYKAWKNHLSSLGYAVAEFNWWRGTGEKTSDYYQPVEVVQQVRAFLLQQGYTTNDRVVLHGFSRGSANTYAVIANDRMMESPVFDAVISNAGKYQSSFPLATTTLTDQRITQLFKNIPWVLACGGKDDNPTRDGCPGMAETAGFLTAHQANVLGTVTDPNQGHGAFHMSSLGLPKQAITLIEAALK